MKQFFIAITFLLLVSPVFGATIDFTENSVTIDCTTAKYCQPVNGAWGSEYFFIRFDKPSDYSEILSGWRSLTWNPTYLSPTTPIIKFTHGSKIIVINRDYIASVVFAFGNVVKLTVPKKAFFRNGMTPTQWNVVKSDYTNW